MQGRLSSEIAGKYQYFPIHNWRSEFYDAQKIGFDGIEWIISDYSNPLFDPSLKNEIIELITKTGIKVNSINLDLFMHKTIDKYSNEEIDWVFYNINDLAYNLNLKRVSIPVEEDSGIKNPVDGLNIKNVLKQILKKNKNSLYALCIETDMSGSALHSFLNEKSLKGLGAVVDLGNIAAYGFPLQDYIKMIPEKIYGIHIKDRYSGVGKTTKLGLGAAEFNYLRKNIKQLTNLIEVTLQCARSKNDYMNDAIIAKKFINKLFDN